MCGRPMTPEALARDREANAFQRPEEPPAPPPIGFGNRVALRACYWNAVIAALFASLPVASLMCFLWFPAAGFFSVAAYRRRAGVEVSVNDGMKLGWITGVVTFAMWLILFSIGGMASDGGMGGALENAAEQFRKTGQAESAEILMKVAGDPALLALTIVFTLATVFALTAGLATLGGALGARVLEREKRD